MDGSPPHFLVFEPQTEGHHLSWLRYITEDLLAAGARLTLALDQRPPAQDQIREQLADLLPSVSVIAARTDQGWIYGGGQIETVAFCQQQCGAEHVFLACIDEIGSQCLRRAAFGRLPPPSLRGCMGGIYIRPKFLERREDKIVKRRGLTRTLKEMIKLRGFNRLLKEGWFQQILLLDENLVASLKSRLPDAPIYFIPDTCPDPPPVSREASRKNLNVPADAMVFLFYGGPYRRKGLDLAVEAFEKMEKPGRTFLLCAGQQPDDPAITRKLQQLNAAGRACAINRYVSLDEESLVFAAADWVLLPYRGHFGSSGVLIRAACRGLPVIASDEELVGWRVREHGLGLLFPSGNAADLRRSMERAAATSAEELKKLSERAKKFSGAFSRAAFRKALLDALRLPGAEPAAARSDH